VNTNHLQHGSNNSSSNFDLEKYLRAAGGTRPENFDWSDPGGRLNDDELFCIGYMMDIESHTIIYLRELLSTAIAQDVSITSFLSCWVYEEFFHSQVLKRLLESQGLTIDDRRFADLRRARPADYMAQKVARALSRITRHFPAVHMTWGAINELSTLTGYQALIDRARHPLLTRVLSRIIKDERRHFSFYFNQARRRLQLRAARTLTSLLVRNFWTPVGRPVRGDADARRICGYLFGDEQGPHRLAEHDSMIARLPGLEWFDMASRYCFDAPLAGGPSRFSANRSSQTIS
jgi:rubrerythrin